MVVAETAHSDIPVSFALAVDVQMSSLVTTDISKCVYTRAREEPPPHVIGNRISSSHERTAICTPVAGKLWRCYSVLLGCLRVHVPITVGMVPPIVAIGRC